MKFYEEEIWPSTPPASCSDVSIQHQPAYSTPGSLRSFKRLLRWKRKKKDRKWYWKILLGWKKSCQIFMSWEAFKYIQETSPIHQQDDDNPSSLPMLGESKKRYLQRKIQQFSFHNFTGNLYRIAFLPHFDPHEELDILGPRRLWVNDRRIAKDIFFLQYLFLFKKNEIDSMSWNELVFSSNSKPKAD